MNDQPNEKVQRLRAVVVRNGAMVYPHFEDDDTGNVVTFADYESLRAQYEAEKADALRYRWLRENAVEVVVIPPGERFGVCFSPMDDGEGWRIRMDETFDAAIAKDAAEQESGNV